MKKLSIGILIILGSIAIIVFGLTFKTQVQPNTVYRVFLKKQLIGTVESKKDLEEYIDKQGSYIKSKYNTNKVYAPKGLEIKKVITYDNKVDSLSYIYEKLKRTDSFTIDGYSFSITKNKKEKKIYTKTEDVFSEAIEKLIKIFVGEEEYKKYLEDNQDKITTTGTIIENIYLDEDITIKKEKIPSENKIFTDSETLADYLLFGEKPKQKTYIVHDGDNISTIAFNNKISTDEFLISNPTITSKTDLLFNGQQVIIKETNPQVNVIVEEYQVKDVVSKYKTEEQYDDTKLTGDDKVIQEGVDGLERVSQNVKRSNREILYVDPVNKEELKPTVNRIVIKGNKVVSGVGSGSWAWPTNSGYTIASDYGYRIDPIRYTRLLHDGIDISGTGYGSPIYAANNGVVVQLSYHYMNGNYIVINHNNGYYTMYAHLSGFNTTNGSIVEKGQVIGYVGSTGYSTGPHLHFGVAQGGIPYNGGTLISPWTIFN